MGPQLSSADAIAAPEIRGRDVASEDVIPAAFALLGVAALWFLRHPYVGIWHDARIYMGRGLADLDPEGVGADLFFRFDGQSSFSIFSKFVDALIPALGLAPSAMLLTAVGLALWFAAFAALAARLAEGRLRWAILIAVAASRGSYGAFEILHYAESFASPRLFAEAGVLAALAAQLAGSRLWTASFLALAMAFHPLMTLVGAGVIYVRLCEEDRRWIYAGCFCALGAILAASLGAPLFSRLLERYDRSWLVVLRLRSTYLFPSMWGEAAYAAILVQAAIVGFAARLSAKPLRSLLRAILISSLAGLLLALALGDLYPVVLIVQAQLWRSLWLLSLFSVVAICLCAPRLWAQGFAASGALALLTIGWLSSDAPEGALAAFAAIALYSLREFLSSRAAKILGYASWGAVLLFLFGALGLAAYIGLKSWREAPPDGFGVAQIFCAGGFAPMLVTFWALFLAASTRRFSQRLLTAAALASALVAAVSWNGETGFARALAANRHPPELLQMLAPHPGEVLWIGENEAPWVWLGRANWASYLQGGGAVFSRSLTLVWRDRMVALLENDWIERALFEPWRRKGPVENPLPEFTREKIERICARADAPAWILGAVTARNALPEDVTAQLWRGPVKFVARRDASGAREWERVEDVAAIACADYLPPSPR